MQTGDAPVRLGMAFVASLIRHLCCAQRAALADLLDRDIYKRLNLALVAWAAGSIALSALKYQLFRPPALLCVFILSPDLPVILLRHAERSPTCISHLRPIIPLIACAAAHATLGCAWERKASMLVYISQSSGKCGQPPSRSCSSQ